jgi:hypothetical protein
VDCRADLLNLRTACRLKLPYLTGGRADQAAATEKQKEKNPLHTGQQRGKIMTELLLKYQHED